MGGREMEPQHEVVEVDASATAPEVTPLRRTPVSGVARDEHVEIRPGPAACSAAPAADVARDGGQLVSQRPGAELGPSAPTARDFTSESLLRAKSEVPRSGL